MPIGANRISCDEGEQRLQNWSCNEIFGGAFPQDTGRRYENWTQRRKPFKLFPCQRKFYAQEQTSAAEYVMMA